MKKFFILSICAAMGIGAMAQESVVKDAEKAMKDKKLYTEVVKIVTPAFSDPATKSTAKPYYIAGKSGVETYDQIFKATMLNPNGMTPEQGDQSTNALLGAYKYFMMALPLDQLPDEKGKVKPKFTKEINSILAGHHSDYDKAAVTSYNNQKYGDAYDCWDIYVKLADNPEVAKILKSSGALPNDTVLSGLMFNMGIAAYLAGDYQKSVDAFMGATKRGYEKKEAWDYALDAANRLGDQNVVTEIAKSGYKKFGSENANYIGFIINGYLESNKYNECLDVINEAIALYPNVSEYYRMKAYLQEQDGINQDPVEAYETAIALDPQNAIAMHQYAAHLYKVAGKINDEAPNEEKAYAKIKAEQIDPLLNKAASMLKKAIEIYDETDQDTTNAKSILEAVNYLLGIE